MDTINLKKVIIDIEEKRNLAWINQDSNSLKELLDEKYIEINSLGRFTKEEVLKYLFSKVKLIQYDMKEIIFTELNDNSAILSYYCYEIIEINADKIKSENAVTSIYLKSNDIWKLAMWQITPLI